MFIYRKSIKSQKKTMKRQIKSIARLKKVATTVKKINKYFILSPHDIYVVSCSAVIFAQTKKKILKNFSPYKNS